MSVVIVGAGDIGTHLASILSEEQLSVTLIDPDEKRLEAFSRSADIATVCASPTNWRILDEILEQEPRLFLAVTERDDTNLSACTLAKNLGYPTTVARICDPLFLEESRLDFDRLFYVDHLIAPEVIVASELFKCLSSPGSIAMESFAHGAVQMRTLVLPSNFEQKGKPLQDLQLGDDLLVGVIRRKKREGSHEEQTIIFPHGSDELMSGDEVTFVGETGAMLNIASRFGLFSGKVQSAVIAGATPVTIHLSKILRDHEVSVKVIEKDLKLCESFARGRSDITVINQDPSNLSYLLSERVEESDVFLSCTDSTEFNILTASLAQEAGCANVYTLVSDLRHAHLLKRLGIEYALSQKESVASRVLSFIHSESAVSMRTLYENQAVIMEVKVATGTQIAGVPISDLGKLLPKNCLIALIENRGQIMIAKGDRILAPGDTVILITSPEHITQLREMF